MLARSRRALFIRPSAQSRKTRPPPRRFSARSSPGTWDFPRPRPGVGNGMPPRVRPFIDRAGPRRLISTESAARIAERRVTGRAALRDSLQAEPSMNTIDYADRCDSNTPSVKPPPDAEAARQTFESRNGMFSRWTEARKIASNGDANRHAADPSAASPVPRVPAGGSVQTKQKGAA